MTGRNCHPDHKRLHQSITERTSRNANVIAMFGELLLPPVIA